MAVKKSVVVKGEAPSDSLPLEDPPFTFAELKACIPKHCFERNTLRSFSYVFMDLAAVYMMYLFSSNVIEQVESVLLQCILWPIYWWWQGAFMTGLWVIAHECGHRAFSDNIFLGDCVGLVLHSALLVPYHSWRISHAKHHKNTNNMDLDEVFVPYTADEVGEHPSVADEVPGPLSAVLRIAEIVKMLVFGWPAYLTMHVTGRRYPEPTNHFNPNVPLFSQKEWGVVVLSDIGLVAWTGVLGAAVYHFGLAWLVKQYLVPYLIVNMWLVMITDLQHTDPRLPHYKDGVFSWMRGALCTMDRDYGVMNVLHHHIGDTHVAHHLFSTMPHYHAQEATEALKKKLGDHYLVDNVSPGLLGIAEALWKTSEMCRFVDNEGDVLWWHRYKSEVETDKSK